jgi:hypothetical protein
MHSSRSYDAVIRVYDAAGNMIKTPEHVGDFVYRPLQFHERSQLLIRTHNDAFPPRSITH